MFKLLIVEDEPLVQVGIKSILNWHEYNIEICGTAMNGEQGLKLIKQYSPEIVITDIKMPIMDGLQLIQICKEQYGKLPLFLILTSYEEFPLIKEAMKYGVVDYLIKLELTAPILGEAIQKTLCKLQDYKNTLPNSSISSDVHPFYEKFFISLLHNLFESEEEFWLQAKDLKLEFSASHFTACHCSITHPTIDCMNTEQQMDLYFSTIQMIQNILPKYIPSYIFSLDRKHFCIIFCFINEKKEEQATILDSSAHYELQLKNALSSVFTMVHNYFNVTIYSSIGRICDKPLSIAQSYQDARQIHSYSNSQTPILLFEDLEVKSELLTNHAFNMSLFKSEIRKAFEEYDANALSHTLTAIIDLFSAHSTKYLQAIDAACNILYLSISLLPNGETMLSEIYSHYSDGYRSIYRQTTMEQIINWLEQLRDKLCPMLKAEHKTYKEHLIADVKHYIKEHIEDKLSLNEVASVFAITPNYLSLLFKRHSDVGFSEYITNKKISRAKAMMFAGQLKVYEIADQLGFESAFYFSKVFKKVEGCSPREYMQKQQYNPLFHEERK